MKKKCIFFEVGFSFFFFRWRYIPLWALACRTIPLRFSLSLTNSLHLLTPSTWRSLSTFSHHPFLAPLFPDILKPCRAEENRLLQAYINFPKIYEPPQYSRRQKGGLQQVPHDDLQILGATIQNLIAWATRRLQFVHPWPTVYLWIEVITAVRWELRVWLFSFIVLSRTTAGRNK